MSFIYFFNNLLKYGHKSREGDKRGVVFMQ